MFLAPGAEVLVARDGGDVVDILSGADAAQRAAIGARRATAHPGASTPTTGAPRSCTAC